MSSSMGWMMPRDRDAFLAACDEMRYKKTVAYLYLELVRSGAPPREAYNAARKKIWERAVNSREERLRGE